MIFYNIISESKIILLKNFFKKLLLHFSKNNFTFTFSFNCFLIFWKIVISPYFFVFIFKVSREISSLFFSFNEKKVVSWSKDYIISTISPSIVIILNLKVITIEHKIINKTINKIKVFVGIFSIFIIERFLVSYFNNNNFNRFCQ